MTSCYSFNSNLVLLCFLLLSIFTKCIFLFIYYSQCFQSFFFLTIIATVAYFFHFRFCLFLDVIGPVEDYFGFIHATRWETFVPAYHKQSTILQDNRCIMMLSWNRWPLLHITKRKKSLVAWNPIKCI